MVPTHALLQWFLSQWYLSLLNKTLVTIMISAKYHQQERWVQFRTVQGKTTSPLGSEVWVRAERTREDLENARGRRKDRQEKNQKLEWRVESAGCCWEICGSGSCIGTWRGFWRPCMPDKNTADFTLKARRSSIFLRKPSLDKLN